MRQVTEYINSQLDRSSLNNFENIALKFDPKKIEAAITLVLGRQGLYETFYYEALMNKILEKLEKAGLTDIVNDVRYTRDLYEELPDYSNIVDAVNAKYGKGTVEEIVEVIGDNPQDMCSSDSCSDCGSDCSDDAGSSWEEDAKEEAEKQAEDTSNKDAADAKEDVVSPPGDVQCSNDAYNEYMGDTCGCDDVQTCSQDLNTWLEEHGLPPVEDWNSAKEGDYVGGMPIEVECDNDWGDWFCSTDTPNCPSDWYNNEYACIGDCGYDACDLDTGPCYMDEGYACPADWYFCDTDGICESDGTCVGDSCVGDCDTCGSDCTGDCGSDCDTCGSDCPSDCSTDCSGDCGGDCSTDCGCDECGSDCPDVCVGDCGGGDCSTDCGCDDCDYCSSDCGCDECDGCGTDTGCGCDDCGCDDWSCGADE